MLMSPVKKIENLRFIRKGNRKPFRVAKMVLVDGIHIALMPTGGIWTNWQSPYRGAMIPGLWHGNTERFLRGLVILGVLSQDDVNRHMEKCRENDLFNQHKHDKEVLDMLNKRYGTDFQLPEKRIDGITETMTLTPEEQAQSLLD